MSCQLLIVSPRARQKQALMRLVTCPLLHRALTIPRTPLNAPYLHDPICIGRV
jgi:hypothetical protein